MNSSVVVFALAFAACLLPQARTLAAAHRFDVDAGRSSVGRQVLGLMALCLLTANAAQAATPTMAISATAQQTRQWPVRYLIQVTVPADHHAYLDKGAKQAFIPIQFDPNRQLAATGIRISQETRPTGAYDPKTQATVLRGSGEFMLELAASPAPTNLDSIDLQVVYQLCNDLDHVCFRPKTTAVTLALPAVTSPAAAPEPTADQAGTGLTENLVRLFHSHKDNALLLFGLLWLAGLLSVATPCVYPMLPITSLLIANRAGGGGQKPAHHALAYVAGIVSTYMALGLAAGMTGGAFNTLMQSAAANLSFALFFAFFALSMFGFYELSFLQNQVHDLDRQSAKVPGVTGTFMMGTVAGLVISPCVGPIVFAVLLQVADTIAAKTAALAQLGQELDVWGKLAIASQGSVMMAGFGLGVGLPFFILGVVKFKPPKAGYWMDKIKYAFGWVILYIAFTYLQKGLGVLGAEPAASTALALGLLGLWLAVVSCKVWTVMPQDALPQHRLRHFAGVASLLVGGWLVINSLEQIPALNPTQLAGRVSAAQPAATAAGPRVHVEAGITWHKDFAEAQKIAQATGKPMFIDFYASWCANCVEFQKQAASHPQLNQALREKAVAVKLTDQEPDFEAFRANPDHRQLKIGLPYFAILSPDGRLLWSGTDYQAIPTIIAELEKWS